MADLDSTLNQMVAHLLNYDEIPFLDLVQFVWRRGWPLVTASEPLDKDPLQCALKACIVERMVELWSSPPKNHSEQVPPWCGNVPPITERYSVIEPEYQVFWKDEQANEIFEKRNIFAPKEFMFFV